MIISSTLIFQKIIELRLVELNTEAGLDGGDVGQGGTERDRK
jgi:hypothetical protein